jgi:hypothetical protein
LNGHRSDDWSGVNFLPSYTSHKTEQPETRSSSTLPPPPPPPRASSSDGINRTDSRSPCKNFVKDGYCRFGGTCRFSHTISSSSDSNNSNKKQPCKHFADYGSCKFGDTCKFNHVAPLSNSNFNSNTNSGSSGSSEQVRISSFTSSLLTYFLCLLLVNFCLFSFFCFHYVS